MKPTPFSHGWAGEEEAGWEGVQGREGGERDAEQAWLWCCEMRTRHEFSIAGW